MPWRDPLSEIPQEAASTGRFNLKGRACEEIGEQQAKQVVPVAQDLLFVSHRTVLRNRGPTHLSLTPWPIVQPLVAASSAIPLHSVRGHCRSATVYSLDRAPSSRDSLSLESYRGESHQRECENRAS